MFWSKSWSTTQMPSLEGKVVLVTGANSGLGEASTRMLALAGASRIYLACRSEERVREALARIRAWLSNASKWTRDAPAHVVADAKASGKATNGSSGLDVEAIMSRLVWLPLDLSSLQSVKEAVETFKAKESRLDVLLGCAGIMATPYALTKDGLEMQTGTNTVGHYLLTMLLMPTLAETARLPEYADTGKTVRVVQVSSMGHTMLPKAAIEGGYKDLQSINRPFKPEITGTWLRYAKSKTGNILLANRVQALADANGLAITSTSVHPGVVRSNLVTSGLGASYGRLLGAVIDVLVFPAQISVEAGALTQLYACTSAEVDEPKMRGAYLVPYAKVGRAAWYARDEQGVAGRELDAFVRAFAQEKVGVDIQKVLEEGRLSKL